MAWRDVACLSSALRDARVCARLRRRLALRDTLCVALHSALHCYGAAVELSTCLPRNNTCGLLYCNAFFFQNNIQDGHAWKFHNTKSIRYGYCKFPSSLVVVVI